MNGTDSGDKVIDVPSMILLHLTAALVIDIETFIIG